MRRKDDTLRDTLLELARNITDREGIDAVNIRLLAQRAGVATGTVYNYFANKEEILLALTEEYWRQALLEMDTSVTAISFCDQLQEIYAYLKEQLDHSAGKFMSSLNNAAAGQARMESMQSVLEKSLIARMEKDPDILVDRWTNNFTREQFARFIMRNMMPLLQADTSDFLFFLAIVKHTIY